MYHCSTPQIGNTCVALFSDIVSDKIYLATDKGLSVISSEKNNYRIKNYNPSNGLHCSSIYSVYENDGEILLCTDKGLLNFYENDLQPSYEIPKVYLNRV